MVAPAEREFLARVARANQAMAAAALPVINGTLDAKDSRWLGAELIAIGEEFCRRANTPLDPSVNVIDGELVSTIDSPQRRLS
ncbi:hypothetical protein LWC34_54495 [Kibdelosporangium philippinense]|uniref:Uncharacterized protein n=1 Tax=Kibdelosporangium philippinense TaxID=211113 RepID=A0ABS8ZW13_9PSEU|nr:hypothetical protein [Kibdelosporangium philippinense]MCE7011769.1 hypothetical protein [Kibdelosporangium philippinense]